MIKTGRLLRAPITRRTQGPNRLLKKAFSCFDRLSTNGKSPTTSSLPPFALSLSKGERRVFQHPAKPWGFLPPSS